VRIVAPARLPGPVPSRFRSDWMLAVLAAAALSWPIGDPASKSGAANLLIAVVAGIGAAWMVSRPVTTRPVGRSELELRVLATTTGAVGAANLARWLTLRNPIDMRAAVVGWLCVAAVLASVAVQTWHRQRSAQVTAVAQVAALPPMCAVCKRAIDLLIVLLALPGALLVIAFAAVAVVLDSPGGWLFLQTRLGAQGRPFRLLKLRTMIPDSKDMAHRMHMAALISGAPVTAVVYGKPLADPRRTRVGRVLRRWSVDELPQLWNVLIGQMSVVGPRPPLAWEAELYSDSMWGRLAGKPGLTGLWQVEGRGMLPFSTMIDLDLLYWDNWSVLQELKILARTPKAVLWCRNTE
jgi:lipopolysaccharide/colanic/teichoic acid biosynthesis glycosyltransferase